MMTVNLYADRMVAHSPTSQDEVWNATQQHATLYRDAAAKIGLTTTEYDEFRSSLQDGKAMYVRLPRHIDAMAGSHRGHAYAVKNVRVPENSVGWKVALSDGTVIYIPQICGNLSMVKAPAQHIAAKAAPKPRQVLTAAAHHAPAVVAVAPDTAVSFTPPVAVPVVASAPVSATPDSLAPSTSSTAIGGARRGSPFWLLVPLIGIGGGLGGGDTTVPPCSQGSNELNACRR